MSPTAIVLLVCLLFGIAGGLTGKSKGGAFSLWFLISAFLPLLGFLAAIAMRDEDRELRRRCTGCGRVLRITDTMCMSCGEDLDFPDTAIVPLTRD